VSRNTLVLRQVGSASHFRALNVHLFPPCFVRPYDCNVFLLTNHCVRVSHPAERNEEHDKESDFLLGPGEVPQGTDNLGGSASTLLPRSSEG